MFTPNFSVVANVLLMVLVYKCLHLIFQLLQCFTYGSRLQVFTPNFSVVANILLPILRIASQEAYTKQHSSLKRSDYFCYDQKVSEYGQEKTTTHCCTDQYTY